jgi:asparagine synthase (glutamine-hydrolysing)
MQLDSKRPTLVNASHFYRAALNPQRTVYSSSPNEVIPIASFEDGLNPACYCAVFHPFAQVVENTSTGECLLVRDHLGLRPLYYRYQSDQLIFGDTILDIICQLAQAPALLDSEITRLFGDVHHYTDSTLYMGIYRVEPGHMVHILPDGRITKSAFWQLEQEGDTLQYRDEREYLEHFTSLMQESVKNATQGSQSLAAEFSAGMDSTAVYGASAALGLNPPLFMHAALPGSTNAQTYNDCYERAFMAQFPSATIHRIMADDFDAIRIFKDYAEWFGGPSPYVFELFAHNIHKAVSNQKNTILLSGFGGDQGVSSHIPTRFILPSLINDKQFRKAWTESAPANTIPRLALLSQYAHPSLHKLIQHAQDLKLNISNAFKKAGQQRAASTHPYHRHYFKALREVEWSFLQGPNSHEVRMRIEYSSIVAKKMGFDYRYPLLHPKLLEFFLSLPLEQKRHQGVGRYLMRRYLAQIMPTAPFNTYKKKEGLNIMPATMDTFKAQWGSGLFQNEFQSLPKTLTHDKSPHKAMIKTIQAFMLNECFNHAHLDDRRKG